jgi:hypothetical protein
LLASVLGAAFVMRPDARPVAAGAWGTCRRAGRTPMFVKRMGYAFAEIAGQVTA